MDSLAITFPGQGSQSVGMLSELSDSFPSVQSTFEEASDILGVDLWSMALNGPADDLNRTENTQPAMLSAGISVWRVWQEQGGAMPKLMAGHSLGEYSALVASGVLTFGDAVSLVSQRGHLMQAAVPAGTGAMAAILGLSDEQVIEVCSAASQGEVAEAVNFNSPGQVVIAGNSAAILRAIELSKEAGARRALPLDVSVPSHCSLMSAAADQLFTEMQKLDFSAPKIAVIQNVNVASSSDLDEIKGLLKQQLYSPVRWVETVQNMADQGIETVIELGPGKVLTGLNKRIDKTLTGLAVLDVASLEKALEAVNG